MIGVALILTCSAALWFLLSSQKRTDHNFESKGQLGHAHSDGNELDVGEAVARTFDGASELAPAMQRALGDILERTDIDTLVLLRAGAFASSGVPRRAAERARTALLGGDTADSVARRLTTELGSTPTAVPIRGADGENAYLIVATNRGEDLLCSPLVRELAASLARSIDDLLARRSERDKTPQPDLDRPFTRRTEDPQKLRVVGG